MSENQEVSTDELQAHPSQENVLVRNDTDETRKRTLTEKGLSHQIELKTNLLRSKKSELSKRTRNTLLKRGQLSNLTTFKKELSEAQVIYAEFQDIVCDVKALFVPDEGTEVIRTIIDQVDQEWSKFEYEIRAEISHLEVIEQQRIEYASSTSKGSHHTSKNSSKSHNTTLSSINTVKSAKFQLRKEEAALKVRLAFAEEERKLKMEQKRNEIMKLEHEEKLEELKLKSELAQNLAKLNVCLLTEKEEMIDMEQDINSVPPVDKDRDMETFFRALQPSTDNEADQVQSPHEIQGGHPTLNAIPPHISHGVSSTPLNPVTLPFTPHSVLEKCMDKLVETSNKLVTATVEQNHVNRQLAIAGQLPKISIPIFSGDPLHYPTWNSSFSALIDSKPMDAQTKLNFLNQYLSGKPRQVIDQYLLIGTENAYKSARKLLQERYGNCSVVGSAFLNKLENWPKINGRDPEALRELSDFLQKVIAARDTTPSLAVLDFAKENVKILAKLPIHIQNKWRGNIKKCRETKGDGTYPSFTEFTAFVKEFADRANIPELDELSKTKESIKPIDQSKKTFRKDFNSFATRVSDPNKNPGGQGKDKRSKPQICQFCKEEHDLDNCKKFAEMSFKQRKDFFFKNFLCFGCASNSQHQVSSCKNKLQCRTCSRTHPTCLHQQKDTVQSISNCTNVCAIPEQENGEDHAMIVPVWVRHSSEPSKEVLQYAVLDDQSNVSFVSQSLCDQLNLQGPPTDLLLTTVQESNVHTPSRRMCGVEVLDFGREHTVKLPMLYKRDVIPANRSQIPKAKVAREWEHLRPIADKLLPYDPNMEISLLIGSNCPSIVRPREVLVGGENDPYGQRSLMGWGIIGKVCRSATESEKGERVCHKVVVSDVHEHFSFSTKAKEIINPQRVLRVLESDFAESSTNCKGYSVEDKRFLSILENGIVKRDDGHYEMPLPLKTDNLSLPNNRQLAVKRWHQLLARFKKNPKFLEDYQAFMKDVITLCAERVPLDRLNVQDGRINYVPHTGVYHPKKKDQIRVVFDCSAQFEGISLNDILLQGPDQMNNLLGILCRFRQERVAFMTDIKSMFHQFMVPEEHRDLLRFLWWKNGDPMNDVVEYRMKVHLFGATSSPGCASFGLKRAASDGESEFGVEAAEFIEKDFYVDDGLMSVPTAEKAIGIIKASQGICAKAGLRLHKIMSNSREVLEAVPCEERAKGAKEVDLKVDPLPLERALGVIWCVENDSFQFRIELHDRPFTRRGMLSTVSSIYDPSGYVAPVTLKGKQILQQMCRDNLDWDSPIPEGLRPQWEKWRQDVVSLEELQVQRCFKPDKFGKIQYSELHHFSDASVEGYGQCSYLRLVNHEDEAYCSFVIGKARVAPLKQITVPRLELAGATVSARVSEFLRQELSYTDLKEYFWTDSKIVLGYVNNEAKRFHVYVANRVQQIRDLTDPSSWLYIDTENNPADDASRGLTASKLLQGSRYLTGPEFLWKTGIFQPKDTKQFQVEENDPEVKKANVFMSRVKGSSTQFPNLFESDRLMHISSWQRLLKVVALCLSLKTKLRNREVKFKRQTDSRNTRPLSKVAITLPELQIAEIEVLKVVQREHFHEEIQVLEKLNLKGEVSSRKSARERNQAIKVSSCLYRLDPFLDENGLVHVGGRIKRANLPFETKHPVVLPRKSVITNLLIRFCHTKVNHMGRGITQNELRQRGYWIIGGSSAVSNSISRCVTCRKLRGSLQLQKMADLPVDRIEPSPPFSYCGVDLFGPFLIKERRSEVKRYGVIFTCMSSRSVHLESANSLSTSSFINALRRFLNRRGPVRQIRSDQGTNFVGARNELKAALEELDQRQLQEYLAQNGCEWISFQMNVPHSSHMGGVWERLIRTVRSALETLLITAGTQLDDEAFRTFLTEAECIVNSRPLSVNDLNDPEAPEPLSPIHLLTLKPKVVLPPPGKFQRADLYCRKWWRRVQYLTNEFWLRWRQDFLQNLQYRKKWTSPRRNLSVGDIVISKEDDGPRNQWPLAKVVAVYPSEDGCVRKVKILKADGELDNLGKRRKPHTFLERPIHKLVLLLACDET